VHFGLENASSESKFRAHSRKICLSLVCLQAGHYYRRQLTDYREFIIKKINFFPFLGFVFSYFIRDAFCVMLKTDRTSPGVGVKVSCCTGYYRSISADRPIN